MLGLGAAAAALAPAASMETASAAPSKGTLRLSNVEPLAFKSGTDALTWTGSVRFECCTVHDIRDYGALCDGATDDSAAVQAAVDAAASDGGYVTLHSGTVLGSSVAIEQARADGYNRGRLVEEARQESRQARAVQSILDGEMVTMTIPHDNHPWTES